MAFQEYWNEIHKKYSAEKPVYDNWLDEHLKCFENVKTPVLDLGCGTGNDALYLTQKGFDVLAVDFSTEALKYVEKHISAAKTKLVDISKKLPFDDGQFQVIVADLSLHYFDNKTTIQIMNELKRVLCDGGYLLARVNSTQDVNYGAGQGEKLEDNFYLIEGYGKRFFDAADVKKYFSIVGDVKFKQAEMLRYEKPKRLFEIEVKNLKK